MLRMKTEETMKKSSCNKSMLADSHSGTNFRIIDTSNELYPEHYFSKLNFEGNCQKKSSKTVSGSSRNKCKFLNGMDMSEVDPLHLENSNEDGIFVPHPDVPNENHVLPNSTRYEVDGTSNGPSDFQRMILDYLSSIDDSQIEPSYKRYLECLSKDENAFMHDVPSEDHILPSSENLNGHGLVRTTDECGRVLYVEPSDIKACNSNQGDPLLRCGGSSWFHEKLSVVLSHPYDENEYEKLWRDATERKCVNRQRQLRSKSKGYVSEKVGRSYLDYYPDLAVQIESAGRDEKLSLLRQFFFWLENSCHEEAYKPWMHETLASVPILADEYEPVQALAQGAPGGRGSRTEETMKKSSCNKSKLADGHSSTNFPIKDTSNELFSESYISKDNFEGNCQKDSKKTVSGSSCNMSEVDPSVRLHIENSNEDGNFVPHPEVPNGDHVLPNSTRYEVDSISNGPSDFQRMILDYLSSIDDSQIEPSYKRYLECLSKDENAFMHDVPSEDHVSPSSENLNGHGFVRTTDECGRVLYIEPSNIKACKNNQVDPLRCGGSSWFDEKLNVVLSHPYDESEYEKLWRDATKRKCVNRETQLRSKSKGSVSDKVGRSYLDYYPDLAVQIESAGRDEKLSLLRKFFFWLENSCHEEAYKPWMQDTSMCSHSS